jgi:hypothetical protein
MRLWCAMTVLFPFDYESTKQLVHSGRFVTVVKFLQGNSFVWDHGCSDFCPSHSCEMRTIDYIKCVQILTGIEQKNVGPIDRLLLLSPGLRGYMDTRAYNILAPPRTADAKALAVCHYLPCNLS